MVDGNGHFGNGKVPSCRKAVAHTVSFSKTKPLSSAVNGGLTFAITAEVSTHIQKQEASKSILDVLKNEGSLITRELRAACEFTGPKMRSRFDAYITRLEMGGYIVTEDFIYPRDRHGREYGWGWSLLTTPETLFGREACHPDRTPQESRERILRQLKKILPDTSEKIYDILLK